MAITRVEYIADADITPAQAKLRRLAAQTAAETERADARLRHGPRRRRLPGSSRFAPRLAIFRPGEDIEFLDPKEVENLSRLTDDAKDQRTQRRQLTKPRTPTKIKQDRRFTLGRVGLGVGPINIGRTGVSIGRLNRIGAGVGKAFGVLAVAGAVTRLFDRLSEAFGTETVETLAEGGLGVTGAGAVSLGLATSGALLDFVSTIVGTVSPRGAEAVGEFANLVADPVGLVKRERKRERTRFEAWFSTQQLELLEWGVTVEESAKILRAVWHSGQRQRSDEFKRQRALAADEERGRLMRSLAWESGPQGWFQ